MSALQFIGLALLCSIALTSLLILILRWKASRPWLKAALFAVMLYSGVFASIMLIAHVAGWHR